jgi:REP element-mobilizing transposase RayT
MARHLRLEYAGAVYHVTARGNDRSTIFHTEEDRRHLLEVLAGMMGRYAVVLHAYVLMNNHFHLVVRTLEPNLSRFMHDVNTGFSVWTNKRNRRTGHVFEGRFKAIAMQEEGYLRSVSAYVHLNPVRVRGWQARPVEERLVRVSDYPWSSYRDYTQRQAAGHGPAVICAPVWGDLGARTEREGRKRYREYVRGLLIEESDNPLAEVQRGCYLGGAEFGEWIERLLVGERPISDQVVAHRQWRGPSTTASSMMERISALWGVSLAQIHSRQRPNEARDVAVYLCREVGAKPVGEIGAVLRIKGSAVSLAAKRIHQRIAADQELRKRLEAVKNELINISKT